MKPPNQGKYYTVNQSGQQQSKGIENIPFPNRYANLVQALDPTWYNQLKQSTQEYKHFANIIINEEIGRRIEYRHLIEHPKFNKDWLKSGTNKFYQLFQESKEENNGSQRINGTNTLFWIKKIRYQRIKKLSKPE